MRFAEEPSVEGPWPVYARDLLTPRESEFYGVLCGLYPSHRIFVQVALSQLIDVPEDHPNRMSIRNRFSQLVADFVLCRSDLNVVAVIELDDWSHQRADRQAADARKNKALADAGLKLIRIPDGPIPIAEDLRKIIDENGERGSSRANARSARRNSMLPKIIRHLLIRAAFMATIFLIIWFVYARVIPNLMQPAFHPLATKPLVYAREPPRTTLSSSDSRTPTAKVSRSSKEEIDIQRQTAIQSAKDLQRQKDLAWAAYYRAPANCDHPPEWKDQVACGNRYMQAKRAFEVQWANGHGSDSEVPPGVVLDNQSLAKAR